jgi:hypothetical protein
VAAEGEVISLHREDQVDQVVEETELIHNLEQDNLVVLQQVEVAEVQPINLEEMPLDQMEDLEK